MKRDFLVYACQKKSVFLWRAESVPGMSWYPPGNLKSWFTIKSDMLISQLFQTLLNTQPLQNKTQKIPHREKFFYLIGFVRQALFKVCGVAFLWQKLYISLWFTHLSLKLEIKDSPWIIHIHCILSSIYMHFCSCIPRRFCQTNMPLHIF